MAFGVVLYILLQNPQSVLAALYDFLGVFSPIITGLCIAFILNVPMTALENSVFAFLGRSKHRFWRSLRRPLCIVLTLLIVIGLLVLFLNIKHAFREFAASEIIMGMHVHTDNNPKFWGDFIQSLYNGLSRQIVLTRFIEPLNTLRRIEVVVPSRAEFEPGFHRWLERLCRMAGNLDCRIEFHGRQESLALIREYITNWHPSVRSEYTYMAHWNELPRLAETIRSDHMFVVVTARKGTISYKSALERLPNELMQHFSGKNLMIIFPDQYGDIKEENMTFTEAQHHEESSIYDAILRWINKQRTKKFLKK